MAKSQIPDTHRSMPKQKPTGGAGSAPSDKSQMGRKFGDGVESKMKRAAKIAKQENKTRD